MSAEKWEPCTRFKIIYLGDQPQEGNQYFHTALYQFSKKNHFAPGKVPKIGACPNIKNLATTLNVFCFSITGFITVSGRVLWYWEVGVAQSK